MPRVLASGGCGATTRPPEDVVGDEQPSLPQAGKGQRKGSRVLFLVHIHEDQVEGSWHPMDHLQGIAHDKLHLVVKARPYEPLPRQPGILGRALKGEVAAVGRKRPRNPVGRVAKARPHLQDALCPDEPGELCQKPSHNRTDDREVTRLGELLHLREDGIPVRNEAVKVGLDVRSEHLRGHHSKGFVHPSAGKQTMVKKSRSTLRWAAASSPVATAWSAVGRWSPPLT